MKRVISASTIKKTTKCRKGFQCLNSLENVCEVEYLVRQHVLLIVCKKSEGCNYWKLENGLQICKCPTRLELNRKYRI